MASEKLWLCGVAVTLTFLLIQKIDFAWCFSKKKRRNTAPDGE